jgi:hypothetical protein
VTHYHEVYFNDGTNDGPRVGATRRTKVQIERERREPRIDHAGNTYLPFRWPGAAIVRCDRPDSQCPWTVDGVPGEEPRT